MQEQKLTVKNTVEFWHPMTHDFLQDTSIYVRVLRNDKKMCFCTKNKHILWHDTEYEKVPQYTIT